MDVRTINKCLDGTLGILPWCAVVEEVVGIDVVSVDETMSLRNQFWWYRVFVVLRLYSTVAAQALPHPIQTSPCNRYMDNSPVLGKQKIKCFYMNAWSSTYIAFKNIAANDFKPPSVSCSRWHNTWHDILGIKRALRALVSWTWDSRIVIMTCFRVCSKVSCQALTTHVMSALTCVKNLLFFKIIKADHAFLFLIWWSTRWRWCW